MVLLLLLKMADYGAVAAGKKALLLLNGAVVVAKNGWQWHCSSSKKGRCCF